MILVDSQQEMLQHAEWIGGSGQALALVKNNDLFYKVFHTCVFSQSNFGSVLSSDPLSVMAYYMCAVHLYVFDFHVSGLPRCFLGRKNH